MLQAANEVKIKSYDFGLQIYIYMLILSLIPFLIVTFSIEKMPGMEAHTI